MTVICVSNLAFDISAARTRALFEPYGEVQSVSLAPGKAGHRFGAVGLVEMTDDAAQAAIAELDGRVLDGTVLRVCEATAPDGPSPTLTQNPATPLDNATPSNLLRRVFTLASVEKVQSPGGGAEDDWYRYVLASGPAQITGLHRGTLAEVTAYANQCAEAFNQRSLTGKSSRQMTPLRRK